MPNINKSKHPKKGNTNNKMEGPMSKKTKKTTKEGGPYKEHQVLKPLFVVRSISNKERGGPLERTPSLEEPSFITITHLKMNTVYTCCNDINTLYL